MLKAVAKNIYACLGTLVVSDLLFKAIAFILLTPLVGLLFRLFLMTSGRTVLADADIARFLAHPTGWLAFVLVGGASTSVLALELAVLMTVAVGAEKRQAFKLSSVLLFVMLQSQRVLRLTTRVVARIALLTLPFAAIIGFAYWALLTDRDINYYLAYKPPRFWIACGMAGVTLCALAALLLRLFTGWAFALPLLLYKKLTPAQALKASEQLANGHRVAISRAFLVWAVLCGSCGAFFTIAVMEFGERIVPLATGSLWTLVLALGGVMLLATVANLATSSLQNITCGSLLAMLYLQVVPDAPSALPVVAPPPSQLGWLMQSRARILAVSLIAMLAAALLGATAIHTAELEDRVEITAHRGGAGVAPENTLAAIQRAIVDGADWVEIDVQESKDGVVVVYHDSDLTRVAGESVKIWDATLKQLNSIDIGSHFSAEFQDQRVPTLEEVLQLCRGKVRVNIELKYYGHTQDLENRVIELVERHGMAGQIVIMSLESRGIAQVKALRPQWTVGLLTAVAAGDLTRLPVDFLAVNNSIAKRPFIATAHKRAKTVSAWTVNEPYAISQAISQGVDNLITDYPARARQVLAERSGMSPVERLAIELAFYLGVQPPKGGGQ